MTECPDCGVGLYTMEPNSADPQERFAQIMPNLRFDCPEGELKKLAPVLKSIYEEAKQAVERRAGKRGIRRHEARDHFSSRESSGPRNKVDELLNLSYLVLHEPVGQIAA